MISIHLDRRVKSDGTMETDADIEIRQLKSAIDALKAALQKANTAYDELAAHVVKLHDELNEIKSEKNH